METKELPEGVKQEYLDYLNELRESGRCNMFEAVPYLKSRFDLSKRDAETVLFYWMDNFDEEE